MSRRPAVVLVDGRSGSGKTVLAGRLAAELTAQILPVEALYPGWDGLAEGSAAVVAALDRGAYLRYDWLAGEFAEAVPLADGPLVIEGCGAITRANLSAARRWAERWAGPGARVQGIWLEMDAALRRERALARDGETFAPHWERWAAQERAHFGEHRPWLLADEVRESG